MRAWTQPLTVLLLRTGVSARLPPWFIAPRWRERVRRFGAAGAVPPWRSHLTVLGAAAAASSTGGDVRDIIGSCKKKGNGGRG